MSFLALLAEVGLGAALVRAPGRGTQAAASAIAQFFAEDRLVPIIRVLALQFLLMIFTVIPLAILSRRLDFKRQSMIDLASAVCGSLSTLGWALVVCKLVSAAMSVAFNMKVCKEIIELCNR